MRIAIAALFLLNSCLAFASEEPTASKKTGTDENLFLLKKYFSANNALTFGVARYTNASESLSFKADETCPAGYDKLAESVRKESGKASLIWEIRCITPSTPVATAPLESK